MTQEINLNEITIGVEALANLLNKHPGLISRFTFSKKDNRIGEFTPTSDGFQLNIIDPTRMGQVITTYKEDNEYLCFKRFFNELKLPSVMIELTPELESLMKEEGLEFTNPDHKEIFAFLKLLMTNTVNADMYRIPLQGDKSLVLKMVGRNTTQAIICQEQEVKDIICGKDILKINADIRHLSSTPKTALKELLEHYGNLGQELKLNSPCLVSTK